MRSPFALLMLLCSATGLLGQEACLCGSRHSVGPSFKVHGRLSAWNGTPTLRIWIVGTKRILGVHEEGEVHLTTPLPKELMHPPASFVSFWNDEVYGDFELCPLTKSRPGVMQFVCIKSASNLVWMTRKK